jgi:hypothetical protein
LTNNHWKSIIKIGEKMTKKRQPIKGTLYYGFLLSIITPIVEFSNFWGSIVPFSFDSKWVAISSSNLITYNPPWVNFVLYNFIGFCLLTVLSIVIILLYVRLNRFVPQLIVAYFILKVIYITLSLFLQTITDGPIPPSFGLIQGLAIYNFILAGLWLPYILLSEKVRDAFVN